MKQGREKEPYCGPNFTPYFKILFIGGLAVVLIGIGAGRLRALFPGPLGQYNA